MSKLKLLPCLYCGGNKGIQTAPRNQPLPVMENPDGKEVLWKPVYDEYRRLGYRLRKDDGQMSLFDM